MQQTFPDACQIKPADGDQKRTAGCCQMPVSPDCSHTNQTPATPRPSLQHAAYLVLVSGGQWGGSTRSWLQLMGVTGSDHRRLYIQPLLRSVPPGSRRLSGMSECSAGIRTILRPYLVVREGDRMHARRTSRAWRAKYGQEVPTRPLEPVYGARAVTIYNYWLTHTQKFTRYSHTRVAHRSIRRSEQPRVLLEPLSRNVKVTAAHCSSQFPLQPVW